MTGCCGRGATAVFLARELGVQVVAVDAAGVGNQAGSRDDWIRWARATGESEAGPLLTVLTPSAADAIGFALVSAVRR
ncbi:hypothetical protein SAMN04488543_2037 [Friedmanniella luteola]|uniref:Uncharacterized protein n=1 Tax=Friedmanniella luteola TaxID=546871 RepID=A0A1H1TJG4_9ACTN|nr:hypothetical protein [Friedmanniella luteola]SDS60342.1 hypothetical protein SAMN04488543_2037 [Friedmanniella luteola]